MCNAGKRKDNSAEIARQEEEKRQALISQGKTRIDEAFKGFDDGYYDKVASDYRNYYDPQIEDQYEDARKKLILGLATKGTLDSSFGQGRLADLEGKRTTAHADYANNALDAGSKARGDVENARNVLYQQNTTAADPSQAATAAAQQVKALQAPASYSPLAQLFADFLNTAATGVQAEQNGYRGFGTGLFNSGNGKSAKVVA